MISIFIFFIIIIEIPVIFIFTGKTLLSPTLLSALALGFQVLCYIIIDSNNFYIGDMPFETAYAIFLYILGFFVGETISRFSYEGMIKHKEKKQYYALENERKPIIIDKNIVYIFSLIMIFSGVYDFWQMYQFTHQHLGNDNIFMTVVLIRSYLTKGEYKKSFLSGIFGNINNAAFFLFSSYYFYNKEIVKVKTRIYLLPIFSYIIYLFSLTGRTGFIKVVLYLFFAYMIYNSIINQKAEIKNKLKIFRVGIISIVGVLVFFLLYGFLFRKSTHTISEYFSIYFSSAIYGLNQYIKNGMLPSSVFGEYTLQNLHWLFNKFGAELPIPQYHLPFFSLGFKKSNIYTGIYFPLRDYGFCGMFLTRVFLGYIINFLRLLITGGFFNLQRRRNILFITYFIFLYYPITQVPIADRFVDYVPSIANFIEISFLISMNLFFYLIKGKRKRFVLKYY